MRSTSRWLILATVLALAVAVLAGPASAKGKPGHPDGQTCAAAEDHDAVYSWDGTGTWQVDLVRGHELICIDLTNGADATFTIAAEYRPGGRSLSFSVRDSHPGDFCLGPDGEPIGGPVPLGGSVEFDLAAAAVDVCGNEYTDMGENNSAYALVLFGSVRGHSGTIPVTIEPSLP